MCTVHAPPVIDKNIEDTQGNDQEGSGPFGLEPDGHHSARGKTDQGHDDASDAPFALNHIPKKQEYKQDTSGKEEATSTTSAHVT